jgi:hypothetical protein
VLWLGDLLAARGMPQWLLELHLEVLHDELCAAVPARRAGYATLLAGAAVLRALRERHLDAEALAAHRCRGGAARPHTAARPLTSGDRDVLLPAPAWLDPADPRVKSARAAPQRSTAVDERRDASACATSSKISPATRSRSKRSSARVGAKLRTSSVN